MPRTHGTHRHTNRVRLLCCTAGALAALCLGPAVGGQQRKFFPDDPIQREPETQDASGAQPYDIPLGLNVVENLFFSPGDPATNVRAKNINTADEVPDSGWFTNRIYARRLTTEDIIRGPNTMSGPAPGRWTIIRPKSGGTAPGFTVRDEQGEVWFLNFDSRDNPVAPTAATLVATKLFWAMGYNQIETYLTSVRRENLVIAEDATIRSHGRRRRFTESDLKDVLASAGRQPDGSYRAAAGRAIPGTIGRFHYYGTRPDDPNDVVPHEHRRELRALRVFAAWTNLVDWKAGNTLDALVKENGRAVVRHYLQDVGSTFGTGAHEAREADEGHEVLVDMPSTLKRLATFGLLLPRWATIPVVEHPQIGRIDADAFEPALWKPRVPTAAFRHARDDDNYWAALRVMAFTDEQIAAAVKTGGFTDPTAEELLTTVMIKRRNKIGEVFFAKINPLTKFALGDNGELTFENPAVRGKVGVAPKGYEATWATFDNLSQQSQSIGTSSSASERIQAPSALGQAAGSYIKVSVKATETPNAAWTVPVDVYFRRDASGWTLVGVERLK